MKSLSRVQLFVTPWIVAQQAPLSMGFSRPEYWSGLPFPSAGDLPNPGIEPRSPASHTHTHTHIHTHWGSHTHTGDHTHTHTHTHTGDPLLSGPVFSAFPSWTRRQCVVLGGSSSWARHSLWHFLVNFIFFPPQHFYDKQGTPSQISGLQRDLTASVCFIPSPVCIAACFCPGCRQLCSMSFLISFLFKS